MKFNNKIGLITGGTNGIGFEVAKRLAAVGARLIITGRDVGRGQAAEQALKGRARFIACDLTCDTQIEALFERIEADDGRLNFAVNNAGITAPRAPVRDIDVAAWRTVIDTNLTGTLLCLKYELHMIARTDGGAIVNVSSCAGVQAMADQAAYSVSKAALNCLTQVAAIESAICTKDRYHVRVNAVAPGPTLGGMNTPRQLAANPEVTRRKLGVTAMKRMADPGEIAEAIIFLLSDRASYITGTVLDVDGGYNSGKF